MLSSGVSSVVSLLDWSYGLYFVKRRSENSVFLFHEIIHDFTKKDDFHNFFLLYQKGPLMVISLGIPASVTQ